MKNPDITSAIASRFSTVHPSAQLTGRGRLTDSQGVCRRPSAAHTRVLESLGIDLRLWRPTQTPSGARRGWWACCPVDPAVTKYHLVPANGPRRR